tara:strand:- start:2814 stop:4556 length:1743 start_codon:yes stop_codon:yes gene_type:complete
MGSNLLGIQPEIDSLGGLVQDAQNTVWDWRRQRRDRELNQYKRQQRVERQGLLQPVDEVESQALGAAEAAAGTPANTTGMRYGEIPDVYQGADQFSMRDQLTPQQQAELDTQRERHGSILDTLGYLTGNTSRRSAYEKAVGSTASSRKERDDDRQGYIDRSIGQLILRYSPETSAELKQIMIASGITDVDDLKRAFEIFEQFKPETAPRLASDVLGGEAFAAARPTVAQIMAQNPGMEVDEAIAIAGVVPMPPGEPELGTDAAEAMYIAEANWENMTDEQRALFGGSKDAFVQQRSAEIMIAQKQKPNAIGPQSKAQEKIEIKQVDEMLKAAYIDVSAEQADYQKATTAIKLLDLGVLQTGPTAPTRLTIKKFVYDMFAGSTDENQQQYMMGLEIQGAEFFDVIAKLFGARNISMTKGAVSDREMAIFMSMGPQLIKSGPGNRMLLQIIQNSAQRKIDLYEVFEEFRGIHGMTAESSKLWLDYVRGHELTKKWQADERGFGGIIPREMWSEYEKLMKIKHMDPESGVPDPGGYTMTDNIITADKEGWEFLSELPDTDTPRAIGGSFWIIRNGRAIEVTIK